MFPFSINIGGNKKTFCKITYTVKCTYNYSAIINIHSYQGQQQANQPLLQGRISQRQLNSPTAELCHEASDLALSSILIDTKSLPGQ